MYTDSNNKFVSNLFDLVEYVYYGSNVYEGDKKLLNQKIKRSYERCKSIVDEIYCAFNFSFLICIFNS